MERHTFCTYCAKVWECIYEYHTRLIFMDMMGEIEQFRHVLRKRAWHAFSGTCERSWTVRKARNLWS